MWAGRQMGWIALAPLLSTISSVISVIPYMNIMVGYIADGESTSLQEKIDTGDDLGWLPSFPHVLIASSSNFLFGYHIGYFNLSPYHLFHLYQTTSIIYPST